MLTFFPIEEQLHGNCRLPGTRAFSCQLEMASLGVCGEGFLSALTRRRLKRASFSGLVNLQAAIIRTIAEHILGIPRHGPYHGACPSP